MKKENKTQRKAYPSDVTDKQWEQIKELFIGLREYDWPKRELVNAVLYLVENGCKWRSLPHDFPPYSTVHSFYRRAKISGLWDKILEFLVKKTRIAAERTEEPSYALIDSQSVKTVYASENRGFDGGEKRLKVESDMLLPISWEICLMFTFMLLISTTPKAAVMFLKRL